MKKLLLFLFTFGLLISTSATEEIVSNETESDTKNEGINKLTVSDVIVEEAALLGQEVMVPGWMRYFADSSMLYEYAETMTALSVNMDNLNKKQKKGLSVNVEVVVM